MQPQNTLVILSDEHNPRVLGAAGHPQIRTPNLDRLARADQRAKIAEHGGSDAILKKGTFRYSPPPGVEATYF